LNTIMPARLGELFRAEFLNMHLGLSRPGAPASIVVERLFDGLMVVACLLLAVANRQNAAALIDVLMIGGVLFGTVLLVAPCFTGSMISGLFARAPQVSVPLTLFRQALHALHTRRALVIEFAGGPRALGIAAATLAQLCLLFPVAVVAVGILVHHSGSVLYAALTKRGAKLISAAQ
jgi:hypothetical protein